MQRTARRLQHSRTVQVDYDLVAHDHVRHRRFGVEVLEALERRGRVGWGSRVLEVGCGAGEYAIALHGATGADCTGLDRSPAMLDLGEEAGSAVRLVLGRAELLPFPPESFDLVFSVDVVHHLDDLAAACAEAHRVLARGGRLCTVTDDGWTIRHREPLARYWPETVTTDLRRYPPLAVLCRTMSASGLRGLEVHRVERHGLVADAAPYRDRAFSCLRLISREAFVRGLDRLEIDLEEGPVPYVVRHTLVWGTRDR